MTPQNPILQETEDISSDDDFITSLSPNKLKELRNDDSDYISPYSENEEDDDCMIIITQPDTHGPIPPPTSSKLLILLDPAFQDFHQELSPAIKIPLIEDFESFRSQIIQYVKNGIKIMDKNPLLTHLQFFNFWLKSNEPFLETNLRHNIKVLIVFVVLVSKINGRHQLSKREMGVLLLFKYFQETFNLIAQHCNKVHQESITALEILQSLKLEYVGQDFPSDKMDNINLRISQIQAMIALRQVNAKKNPKNVTIAKSSSKTENKKIGASSISILSSPKVRNEEAKSIKSLESNFLSIFTKARDQLLEDCSKTCLLSAIREQIDLLKMVFKSSLKSNSRHDDGDFVRVLLQIELSLVNDISIKAIIWTLASCAKYFSSSRKAIDSEAYLVRWLFSNVSMAESPLMSDIVEGLAWKERLNKKVSRHFLAPLEHYIFNLIKDKYSINPNVKVRLSLADFYPPDKARIEHVAKSVVKRIPSLLDMHILDINDTTPPTSKTRDNRDRPAIYESEERMADYGTESTCVLDYHHGQSDPLNLQSVQNSANIDISEDDGELGDWILQCPSSPEHLEHDDDEMSNQNNVRLRETGNDQMEDDETITLSQVDSDTVQVILGSDFTLETYISQVTAESYISQELKKVESGYKICFMHCTELYNQNKETSSSYMPM